jgi:hypothetical protein
MGTLGRFRIYRGSGLLCAPYRSQGFHFAKENTKFVPLA